MGIHITSFKVLRNTSPDRDLINFEHELGDRRIFTTELLQEIGTALSKANDPSNQERLYTTDLDGKKRQICDPSKQAASTSPMLQQGRVLVQWKRYIDLARDRAWSKTVAQDVVSDDIDERHCHLPWFLLRSTTTSTAARETDPSLSSRMENMSFSPAPTPTWIFASCVTRVQAWQNSTFYELIHSAISKHARNSRRIYRIVCFGFGSFAEEDSSDTSLHQHLAACAIAQGLHNLYVTIDKQHQFEIPIFCQDPAYTLRDIELLHERFPQRITAVTDPEGFLKIDKNTLVISGTRGTQVMEVVADALYPDVPAAIFANELGDFNADEKAWTPAATVTSLVVEMYEKMNGSVFETGQHELTDTYSWLSAMSMWFKENGEEDAGKGVSGKKE
jgi:hypothetical protein